jgi:hypothetical protein
LLRAWLAEERGEGTSSAALRIALWVAIALAAAGVVAPGVYRAAKHVADCTDAAASGAGAC